MAISPVTRASLSPVPPMGKELGLVEKWLTQLTSRVYGQRVDTQVSAVATATLTNVLVLPPSRGLWLCAVSIGPVADAVNYQAFALVAMDGTSARIVVNWNAPSQSIALSGNTLQSTQSSGSVQTLIGTAIQLTNF